MAAVAEAQKTGWSDIEEKEVDEIWVIRLRETQQRNQQGTTKEPQKGFRVQLTYLAKIEDMHKV